MKNPFSSVAKKLEVLPKTVVVLTVAGFAATTFTAKNVSAGSDGSYLFRQLTRTGTSMLKSEQRARQRAERDYRKAQLAAKRAEQRARLKEGSQQSGHGRKKDYLTHSTTEKMRLNEQKYGHKLGYGKQRHNQRLEQIRVKKGYIQNSNDNSSDPTSYQYAVDTKGYPPLETLPECEGKFKNGYNVGDYKVQCVTVSQVIDGKEVVTVAPTLPVLKNQPFMSFDHN